MKKFAVIGYGSWATTLVGVLAGKGIPIKWLVSNPDIRESLVSSGYNCKYVSDMDIDMSNIELCGDVNETVGGADVVLLACPSAFLKANLEPLTVSLDGKFIISAIKGIVSEEYVTVLEYMNRRYGIPFHRMGVISGPSHAEEVSRGKLSYLTFAGSDAVTNEEFAGLFSTRSLTVNTSLDIYGIEYASVLKNVYALAAGLACGLGYGDNFLAVLVSASADEMGRFINGSYPFERNVNSRAYLGDLLVTCYSNFSRNRRLGQLIGKGCTVKSAINEMTMVAEGYFGALCINNINKVHKIPMPIAETVYNVLYQHVSARRAMASLAKMI